ncbi:MAG: dTMP kinase [Armatimonadetes bacterium]|nr:dTMP kinase [Armatimonadota bacterium]
MYAIRGNGVKARGKFITFEGIEGVGKSTQIHLLAENLRDGGYSVLVTREPGGTPLGEKIRAILSDPANGNMSAKTELCLFLAARAQHTRDLILPALLEGTVVLSDRYADASVAYQGDGRGLGPEFVKEQNDWATDGLAPDLTFWLDLPPELGLSRVVKRFADQGVAPDRLDQETLEFYRRVRKGYHELALQTPARIIRVQAEQPVEKVQKEILSAFKQFVRKQETSGVS